MGGNALSTPSMRLDKSRYVKIANNCVSSLRALYPNKRIEALGSYRAKDSFGDCDILVEGGDGYNPFDAAAALNVVEVVRNGPVTSMGVLVQPEVQTREGNLFQVDLILIEPQAFSFALGYFGASDTGNLVGRIAHSMGLSLRHDGLYFYHRDGDYKFRELLLTRDYGKALEFMGYDPAVFTSGFDELVDIYRFVASTPFFNRDIYLLENRNAKSRVRDKKRKVYMEFLQWCEALPEHKAFVYPEDKSAWLPRIASFFPHFQAQYDQSLADLAELRAVKAKFSGEWVSQLTGLQGKELGGLMKRFKESFDSAEAQREFILANTPAGIELRVRQVLRDMSL